MSYRKLEGIPTFSGEVIKSRVELNVQPIFDNSVEVKIGKIQLDNIPSISQEPVKVIKQKLQKPAFDKAFQVQVVKNKGSRDNAKTQ